MRQSLCVFTLLSSALFCAGGVQAYDYIVTDLGTLGGRGSFGSGINSSGQVAGYASTPQNLGSFPQHAFLWTPTVPGGTSGTMLDLGTLGADTTSFGTAINDKGQVTGRSGTGGPGDHAFLYDGTMHDLGTLGGTFSDASGINPSGQVTGRSYPSTTSLNFHAYLYDGTMHDIGTLGGNNSEGLAINAAGHVTGDSDTSVPNIVHAFLYDGVMHDLGTLGGPTSVGLGINSSEHVTGWSILVGGESHAFLYDGTMHDLGVAGENSSGNGINSSGQVVGDFFRVTIPPSITPEHAFLYSNATGMVDLNSLIDPQSGWELTSAQAINDAGQITGYGQIGGQQHAFLATPIPEPAAIVIASFGFLGCVALYRRQRSRIELFANHNGGMTTHCLVVSLLFAFAANVKADVFNMPAGQTSLEFVTVGDPGNAAFSSFILDGATGTTGHGSVNYAYQIGKFDVTAGQYTQFLNAVGAADTYGLYQTDKGILYPYADCGIVQSGNPGSFKYSIPAARANLPVNFVSWASAARFTNWLQNGQPTGAQGPGTTETGAYTLIGVTSDASLLAITRNPGAKYAIPTLNEWLKAAYYKGNCLPSKSPVFPRKMQVC